MSEFKPPSPEFIAARYRGGPQKPKAIVLHGTVSSDNAGTARNIALWWNGPNSPKSSAHYVRDPKETIQCVGDHTVAYHCGFNQDSIGYEFCDEQTGPASRWDDADSRAILAGAATDIAKLCLAYGIAPRRPTIADLKAKGPHGIYGHNDSRLAFGNTTHTDPRDFPWAKFLRMVRREIRRLKREARPTFKVLHAPLHGASATRAEMGAALSRPGVVSVAFSEAWRQSGWLSRRGAWRATTGDSKQKDERGRMTMREMVLLTRRWRQPIAHGVVKICEASTPLKIAPDRYMVWSVDKVHGKPLAVIGLHPHAAVMNAWESDRAAEYRRGMRRLRRLVRMLRRAYGDDLDIVIMGDLQYRDIDDGRALAPRALLRDMGFSYVSKGIDWVAWSAGLQKVGATVIRDNGQDHPWVEVELARR